MERLEQDYTKVQGVSDIVADEQRKKGNYKTASLIQHAPEMLGLIEFIYDMEKKANRYGSVRRLCESLLSRV